jgi:hypothetical protein
MWVFFSVSFILIIQFLYPESGNGKFRPAKAFAFMKKGCTTQELLFGDLGAYVEQIE